MTLRGSTLTATERLEKLIEEKRGSVSIERHPPTRHQSLPWSCSFYLGADEEGAGYGTGSTMTEAIEDALTDYEESIEP